MKYLFLTAIILLSVTCYCAEKYCLRLSEIESSYTFEKFNKKMLNITELPLKEFPLISGYLDFKFNLISPSSNKKCLFYKWNLIRCSFKDSNNNFNNNWKTAIRRNLSIRFPYCFPKQPQQISISGSVSALTGSPQRVPKSVVELIEDKKFLKESGMKITYKDISNSESKQFYTHSSIRKKRYSLNIEYEHPRILNVGLSFINTRKKIDYKQVEFKKESSFPGKITECWHYSDISPNNVFLSIEYVPDLEKVTIPFDFKNIQLK